MQIWCFIFILKNFIKVFVDKGEWVELKFHCCIIAAVGMRTITDLKLSLKVLFSVEFSIQPPPVPLLFGVLLSFYFHLLVLSTRLMIDISAQKDLHENFSRRVRNRDRKLGTTIKDNEDLLTTGFQLKTRIAEDIID